MIDRAAQRGRAIGPNNDLFRLSLEINPYPAGGRQKVAHGDATGRAVISDISNTTQVRRYMDRTAKAKEGLGSLYLGARSDYLEFKYTARSAVWKGVGNAIQGLNWAVGGWWISKDASTNFSDGGDRYLVSVQDSGRTAAGTAFKFVIDNAGTPFFYVSDGTTIFKLGPISGTAQALAAGGHYLWAECVDGVIHFSCDGVVLNSALFGVSPNVPSGGVLRFGQSVATDQTYLGFFADMWQIKGDHLYSGGNFTPPTWPVGFRAQARIAALAKPAVQLRFEDSPGFLIDEGSAGSTWTNSNGSQVATSPKERAKYLTLPGITPLATNYITTAANSSNCMNGSGDCAMGGWFQQFGSAGTSGYICGVREGAASASETGVFWYRGGGSDTFFFFYSDGTTISNIDSGVVGTTTATWRHLWAEQYTISGTKKIFIYVDGALKNSGGTAFSGSIPIPSGGKLRVGSLGYTVSGGAANMVAAADLFQVYQRSLYKGAASFTPPVLGR